MARSALEATVYNLPFDHASSSNRRLNSYFRYFDSVAPALAKPITLALAMGLFGAWHLTLTMLFP